MTTSADDALPFGTAVFDLTGKVAVVTGAGGGIGRANARLLASVGAAVCAPMCRRQR